MSKGNLNFKNFLCINNKFLIYSLVARNLKIKYRKSFLGILWTMLIPAANALVYGVVFKYIMKVQIPNYLIFLLSGLLPWTFFSTTLINGMESLVANHSVLNKVPISAFTFVLAETLTAFTNFFLSLPIFFVMFFIYGIDFNLYLAIVPFAIFLLLVQAYGLSVILAYAFVYFRDLRFLFSIIIQIWFYLTPILYSAKMIPEKLQPLTWLNPVAVIFHIFHASIGSDGISNPYLYILPIIWTFIIIFIAFLVMKRFNEEVVESL
jgi:ABC-type polysaccharide/polyol phosphate export permease